MDMDTFVKLVLPITAGAIAVLGLALASAKFALDRKHARAAAMPRLEVFRREDEKTVTSVWLSNQGDGPGEIRSYELVVDGAQAYACTTVDAYRTALTEVGIYDCGFYCWTTEPGKTIGKGTEIELLSFEPKDTLARRDEIREKLERIRFRFRYQSKFGEDFEVCR